MKYNRTNKLWLLALTCLSMDAFASEENSMEDFDHAQCQSFFEATDQDNQGVPLHNVIILNNNMDENTGSVDKQTNEMALRLNQMNLENSKPKSDPKICHNNMIDENTRRALNRKRRREDDKVINNTENQRISNHKKGKRLLTKKIKKFKKIKPSRIKSFHTGYNFFEENNKPLYDFLCKLKKSQNNKRKKTEN